MPDEADGSRGLHVPVASSGESGIVIRQGLGSARASFLRGVGNRRRHGRHGSRSSRSAHSRIQGFSYLAPLDGLRAFAVFGVMAYHGGISWMQGGFLGVTAFFALSGFLITSLLVAEWGKKDRIGLGAFWARRARRLLPALFLMLIGVALYVRFILPPGGDPGVRLDTLSTLFYVANWHFILVHSDYFATTGPKSPVLQTWSLAIEEQFYLVWPFVVLGVLALARRWRAPKEEPGTTRGLGLLLGVCLAGAVASMLEMAWLYHPGDPTRVYYGTDTRAQALLLGAALAVGMAIWRAKRASVRGSGQELSQLPSSGADAPPSMRRGQDRSRRAGFGLLGLCGSALVIGLAVHFNGNDTSLYRGGFFLAGLGVVAVIASIAVHPGGAVGWVLSLPPIRYLGRISYGIYLWHWPLFLTLDSARTGLFGAELFGARVAAACVAAALSYHLVEQPIRRGGLLRAWRSWLATPAAVAAVLAAIIVASPAVLPPSLVPALGKAQIARVDNRSTATSKKLVPVKPPIQTLLVGASVAFTAGWGLIGSDAYFGIDLHDEGILGCGIATGEPVKFEGTVAANVAGPCNGQPGVEQWPQLWQGWVDEFHPSVGILMAGRWEVIDRVHNGVWMHVGPSSADAVYDAYIEHQLELGVQILHSKGARVIVTTAPCYDAGQQPDGQPWPEDTARRRDEYNKLVAEVAAMYPGVVTVFHLGRLLCPGGKFHYDFAGAQVRCPDGIHLTIDGGEWLATRLYPTVVAVGLAQRDHEREPLPSQYPKGITVPITTPPATSLSIC